MHRIYILLLSVLTCVSASLLAIDYGGEWTKASVIKPGVPFDVLLNRDSKRKIQSIVAWKGEERLFGGDAFSIASASSASSLILLKLSCRPQDSHPMLSTASNFYKADLSLTPRMPKTHTSRSILRSRLMN
jgi:molecular chaperone DnaK (HSP70)